MLRKISRNGLVRALSTMTLTSKEVLSTFNNKSLLKSKAYYNGKWIESSDNRTFRVNNPALAGSDGEFIADITSTTSTDFNTAIESSYVAFQQFKKTSPRYRSDLLYKLYQLMIENQQDLAKLIVLENGKAYADALGEIKYAASFFQWFSEEAPRITGDIIHSVVPGNRILALKQPIGVCGILTPWNFPAAMITRKLAAAIAAGCTVVVKPASETPLSALALAYLIDQAGFPADVINILPTDRTEEIGKLVCEHPLIKKVSFTGSTRVGKILMSQSASTLKKLSLELGGNAPFIVFGDADIDKAVEGAYAAKFRASGQTCICANRLYIHESIYDEFADKFTKKVKATVKLGNGLDPTVTHGPLIHERSLTKVIEHVEDAVSKGATILEGGKHREDIGEFFHDLTVLRDVVPGMKITQEETFGPVAALIKFGSDEELLNLANDTEVGLAGYFYSQDINRLFKISEELDVGMLGVNTGMISEAALPFGGIKESGFGREGSKFGIEDYMIIKSVVVGN
ncbi:aldehyde dehydrogenase domain-containing protein [Scheffersomyces amazonensis]|uniref:aldehyde dehydrogenase domain-containing protein n=1 Tax=Scheffersomyces amazonensis TaxID=1078765 RepID=UPI00315CFA18